MEIQIKRETLLKPLQAIIGVVERRQTLPILANVLLSIKEQELSMTGTDLEVELQARVDLEQSAQDVVEITVPGRKLMDICRSLPEDANVTILQEKDRILLRSGRSRFTLTTLPASDFPIVREDTNTSSFIINQRDLRYLIQRTHFAMAQQDVRYYLNGMMLEVNDGIIRTVATDGHRLALNTIPAVTKNESSIQVILPRKGVTELLRLLEDEDGEVEVHASSTHVRIHGAHFTFVSKLIDGRFPDYEKVLPRGGNKTIMIEKELFKQALNRVSILSNEKFRGVRLQLEKDILRILANNPEQEEAEEEISLEYPHENLEIGFNAPYLLDIFNTVDDSIMKLTFSDSNSSVLIEEQQTDGNSLFVVMPMRL